MLEIQKFLIKNGKDGFNELVNKYKITIKPHPIYTNLIMLNYNKYKSPKCQLTSECRGLVLESNTYGVVCKSFNRFGTLAKPDRFKWSNLYSVKENLDGTLVSIFWWADKWQVCTLDGWGSDKIPGTDITWEILFWGKINKTGLINISKNRCYSFLVTTELFTKIVKYTDTKIYFLIAYNVSHSFNTTYVSIDYYSEFSRLFGTISQTRLTIDNEEGVKEYINKNPQIKGLVISDIYLNNISVKTDFYRKIKLLKKDKSIFSFNNILKYTMDKDSLNSNTSLNFLIGEKVEEFRTKIKKMLDMLNIQYITNKNLGRRRYAVNISSLPGFKKWMLFKAFDMRRRPNGTTLKPIYNAFLLKILKQPKNRKYLND